MQIHATVADLVETDPPWVTRTPDNVGSLLRAASALVTAAVAGSDSADTGALRDATCAQVASWVESGIDPASGGLSDSAPLQAKAVGTARLEYDTSLSASVTAFRARQSIAGSLCPTAIAILEAADLIGGFEIAAGGSVVPEATEIPTSELGWY